MNNYHDLCFLFRNVLKSKIRTQFFFPFTNKSVYIMLSDL